MSERLTDMYARVEAERNALNVQLREAVADRDRLAGQLTHTTTALKRISRAHASAEHLQSVADEALAALVSGGETPR